MPLNFHYRHAIDALIKFDFEPTRTFVWAYGFDEEASGFQVHSPCPGGLCDFRLLV